MCRSRGDGGHVHGPVGTDLALGVEKDGLAEDGEPRRHGKGARASEGPSPDTRLFKSGLFSLPAMETRVT